MLEYELNENNLATNVFNDVLMTKNNPKLIKKSVNKYFKYKQKIKEREVAVFKDLTLTQLFCVCVFFFHSEKTKRNVTGAEAYSEEN